MEKILKKFWYLILFIIVLIVFLFIDNNNINEVELEESVIAPEEKEIITFYYVDVKGEVKNPGVYEVNNNSRIMDVINIAGGLTKNADTSLINLSKKVSDEMNIKIYSKKEVENAKKRLNPTIIEVIKEIEKECICPDVNDACDKFENTNNVEEVNNIIKNKININSATKEELMKINGLGESKANNIIEYRKSNKFNVIEDIQNVNGIGDALFTKIKDFIEV